MQKKSDGGAYAFVHLKQDISLIHFFKMLVVARADKAEITNIL